MTVLFKMSFLSERFFYYVILEPQARESRLLYDSAEILAFALLGKDDNKNKKRKNDSKSKKCKDDIIE